ncbi:MAG: FlgB family protein [Rubellimicrobium sp.]|nr:FlgB family protein [Rubellimicrobium sp.]
MYQSLDLFRVATAMAQHAGARTAVVARNVANADTPGYRATALAPFAEVYRGETAGQLRMSRSGHLSGRPDGTAARPIEAAAERSPNGNNVSIEEQMFRAIEAQREHSRALAIYRHGLSVIRSSLGARS